MKDKNCPFCMMQIDPSKSVTGSSIIIAKTENFVVFPTVGGFVDNYQLIAPRSINIVLVN